jgi:hypothetical protein
MTAHRRPRTLLASVSLMALVATGLSACEGPAMPGAADGAARDAAGAPAQEPARLVLNVRRGERDVSVDTLLDVQARSAVLETVRVSSPAGGVPGELAEDGTSWTALERLEPGAAYTVRAVGRDTSGEVLRSVARFRTEDLTLAEQTFASVAPLDGETVGIGMPVVVSFDVPVTDRASMERHMRVESVPQQPGTWHWISDSEAHWRPRRYWQAGSTVRVDLDVNGVSAGSGVYGQHDRRSPSPWATPTSTGSMPAPTRCASSPTAGCCARSPSPRASPVSRPATGPR